MVCHRSPEAPGRTTEGSGGPPGGPRTPPGPGSKNLKTYICCRALLSSRVRKGQLRLVRVLTLAGLNEVFRHMPAHGVARTEGARLKYIWVYGWLQAAGTPFKKMGGAKLLPSPTPFRSVSIKFVRPSRPPATKAPRPVSCASAAVWNLGHYIRSGVFPLSGW